MPSSRTKTRRRRRCGAPTTAGRYRPAVAGRWAREPLARLAGAAATVGAGLARWAGAAMAQVTVTPDAGQGPGGPQLEQLVNYGAGMALIVCVGAIVFHALRWGWGSQQHNMARVQDGKEGVARAALVAGVIAAAAALINFAVNLGGAVQ